MSERISLHLHPNDEISASNAPDNEDVIHLESASFHLNDPESGKDEDTATVIQSQGSVTLVEDISTSTAYNRDKRAGSGADLTKNEEIKETYTESIMPASLSQDTYLEAKLQEMKQSLREEFECIVTESVQNIREEIKEMFRKERKQIQKTIQNALQEEKNRIIDLVQLVQDAVSEDRQQSAQQQSDVKGEKTGKMSQMIQPDVTRYFVPTMPQGQGAYFVSSAMPRWQTTTVARPISLSANEQSQRTNLHSGVSSHSITGQLGTHATQQNIFVSQQMPGQSQGGQAGVASHQVGLRDYQMSHTITQQQARPHGVIVQGMEPLTATMLATQPPQEQKQTLGERLYPLVSPMFPDLAGKITGMLLEIDNSELLAMLEHKELLEAKVKEAADVLQRYNTKVSTSHG